MWTRETLCVQRGAPLTRASELLLASASPSRGEDYAPHFLRYALGLQPITCLNWRLNKNRSS